MIGADTDLRDIAFEVCTAIERAGDVAVLTGGAAAWIHAGARHDRLLSYDVDFVFVTRSRSAAVPGAIAALGFELDGQSYRHTSNPTLLEFVPGPLSVGGDILDTWTTLREGGRVLHLLHPTDSVRDRLAAFYHWKDRGSLAAALAIQRERPAEVDLGAIERWSERESAQAGFDEFRARSNEGTDA